MRLDRELQRGDRFEIVSAVPNHSPGSPPGRHVHDPAGPDLPRAPRRLPGVGARDSPPRSRRARRRPTTPWSTLQDWFRTEFEYSLEVPQGHGNSAIEAFLRQRIGYCEQFAGTFAAMARSLGIPARVAVGFTPGVAGNGTFTVLGKNAHAWPEVWFDGLGWVAFEPTPGRGAPGAEDYTGVERRPRTSSVPPPGRRRRRQRRPGAPAPRGAGARWRRPCRRRTGRSDPTAEVATAVGGRRHGPGGRTPVRRGSTLLTIVGVARRGVALPAMVRWWRRRHPHADVARQMVDLWQRALGAVAATGFHPDPSLTPLEQARAAAPRLPVAARPLRSLAVGGDGGGLRAARRGRVADRARARRRPRTAPLVPPGGARGRRLDDHGRPRPAATSRSGSSRYAGRPAPVVARPDDESELSPGFAAGSAAAAAAAEPGADRQRAQPLAGQQPDLTLERHRHGQHEEEAGEGEPEADGQARAR